jgi:hypothetical protein
MSSLNEAVSSRYNAGLFEPVASLGPENGPPTLLFTKNNCTNPTWREAGRVASDLDRVGRMLTTDEALGFGRDFRDHLLADYFNTNLLYHHEGDVPVDRERARDVVHYKRTGQNGAPELVLSEYETTTIFDRDASGRIVRERPVSRIETLRDTRLAEFVATVLTALPYDLQLDEGTLGINFFRTKSKVVSGAHHDRQIAVFIYLVDIVGEEVVNRLIPDLGMAAILRDIYGIAPMHHDRVLRPGDIQGFVDDMYSHDVVGSLGEGGHRAGLVLTLDYPTTYEVYGELGSPERAWARC